MSDCTSGGWAKCAPVFEPEVRKLCARPYPGHPRGCPNFGKRPTCPPAAPLLFDRFHRSGEFWLVWNRFDFGAHVARMREKHPRWSERQLRCCLYWQPAARKALHQQIRRFMLVHPGLAWTPCPEALGVNVTETLRRLGVPLEWPPTVSAYQVALAGQAMKGAGRE